MTMEDASRRYAHERIAETIRRSDDRLAETASAVKAAFTTWRHVDPIRKAALECAVHATKGWPNLTVNEVVTLAQQFERYLTGEEANEPTNP